MLSYRLSQVIEERDSIADDVHRNNSAYDWCDQYTYDSQRERERERR